MRELKDDAVDEFRKEQEKWVKSRDDGVKTYLPFVAKDQKIAQDFYFRRLRLPNDEINQSPTTLLGP